MPQLTNTESMTLEMEAITL